jgi:hypothetical protein
MVTPFNWRAEPSSDYPVPPAGLDRCNGAGSLLPSRSANMWYMCYKMDKTIRNLDETAYRLLRSQAVLEGKTVGELMNAAINAYLSRKAVNRGAASLRDWTPEPYPEGNESLSTEIDAIVYR